MAPTVKDFLFKKSFDESQASDGERGARAERGDQASSEHLVLVEERILGSSKRYLFVHTKAKIQINVSGRDLQDARRRAMEIASRLLGEGGTDRAT